MRIEHIAIWTDNLEKLKMFYEKYFSATAGKKYINLQNGFESYFLSFSSGARLELMYISGIEKEEFKNILKVTGYAHLAFSAGSVENVDNLTALLQDDGYKVFSQPRTTGDGYYESTMLDPDGNIIEITI